MKRLTTTLALSLNVILITFSSFGWSKENDYNMTKGVTEISGQVYELHMLIFYICCVIALIVFGVMFYSIFRHRKSKGAVAAHFHEVQKWKLFGRSYPSSFLSLWRFPQQKL